MLAERIPSPAFHGTQWHIFVTKPWPLTPLRSLTLVGTCPFLRYIGPAPDELILNIGNIPIETTLFPSQSIWSIMQLFDSHCAGCSLAIDYFFYNRCHRVGPNATSQRFLPNFETFEYMGPLNPTKMVLPTISRSNILSPPVNAIQGPLQSVGTQHCPNNDSEWHVKKCRHLLEQGVMVKV